MSSFNCIKLVYLSLRTEIRWDAAFREDDVANLTALDENVSGQGIWDAFFHSPSIKSGTENLKTGTQALTGDLRSQNSWSTENGQTQTYEHGDTNFIQFFLCFILILGQKWEETQRSVAEAKNLLRASYNEIELAALIRDLRHCDFNIEFFCFFHSWKTHASLLLIKSWIQDKLWIGNFMSY